MTDPDDCAGDDATYANGHDLVSGGGFAAAMATGQVDVSGLA